MSSWNNKNGRLVFSTAENKINKMSYEAEFELACSEFRKICDEISKFIGSDFHGGLDEISKLYTYDRFNTVKGAALAVKWSAADKLCTYTASKLGIGQPDWFKQCWKQSELLTGIEL